MSYEAERNAIGCLLLDNSCIEKVYEVLSPEKFENATFGRVYGVVKDAYDKGQQVDEQLICFQMSDINQENLMKMLLDSVEHSTTSVLIDKYAKQINDEYKTRQLKKLVTIIPETGSIDKQLENISKAVDTLRNDSKQSSSTLKELVREYSSKRFVEGREQGVRIGIRSVDNILQGVDPGDICLVCARPAVGKTAFALQIALNTAKEGYRPHFFCLEMSKEQMYDRLVAHESGINMTRIRRAIKYIGEEENLFKQANKTLEDLPITIDDDIYTVSKMKAAVKRSGSNLVIIDYAQLIKAESSYKGNRTAEVGEVSHSLKVMAKELGVPIIVLCQLNRVMDETKEPSMNEIRESGDFEQDASIIILLWNTKEDRTEKGCKVDKNRNGTTGKVKLNYIGKNFLFTEEDFVQTNEATPFDD